MPKRDHTLCSYCATDSKLGADWKLGAASEAAADAGASAGAANAALGPTLTVTLGAVAITCKRRIV